MDERLLDEISLIASSLTLHSTTTLYNKDRIQLQEKRPHSRDALAFHHHGHVSNGIREAKHPPFGVPDIVILAFAFGGVTFKHQVFYTTFVEP